MDKSSGSSTDSDADEENPAAKPKMQGLGALWTLWLGFFQVIFYILFFAVSTDVAAAAAVVMAPAARINALMAVKGTRLYLYGGVYEVGDRKVKKKKKKEASAFAHCGCR
jgi:hypothetical protein